MQRNLEQFIALLLTNFFQGCKHAAKVNCCQRPAD